MAFDKFKQIGKLAKLRGQAKAIQKTLAAEEIKVEQGRAEVVVNAAQEIISIKIDGEEKQFLVKVINEALKKSQKVAAKKMQGLAGDLFGLG